MMSNPREGTSAVAPFQRSALMARTLSLSLLAAAASYLLGAFAGGWLVSILSNNQHDRGVEAAMTGAFVLGPLAAVLGFGVAFGVLMARRSRIRT
jgi:hypothetical protein